MFGRFFRRVAVMAIIVAVMATQVASAFAYEVEKGDSLAKIAAQNGCTVAQLMEWNGITDSNMIYVGEKLKTSAADTVIPTRVENGTAGNSVASYSRVYVSESVKKTLKTVFDAEYYAEKYPDVVAVMGNDPEALFNHYISFGLWETRQPEENFNVNVYASAYKDLQEAYADDSVAQRILDYTIHYAVIGKEENREITNIEAAVKNGVEVEYVGSYSNGEIENTEGFVPPEIFEYRAVRESYYLNDSNGHTHTPGEWYCFTPRCGLGSYYEKKCTECNAVCATKYETTPHSIDPSTHRCTSCGNYCEHHIINGACIYCNISSTDVCSTHTWAPDGHCTTCYNRCQHFRLDNRDQWDPSTGNCLTCGMNCSHNEGYDVERKCIICGKACDHSSYNSEHKCAACGKACDHSAGDTNSDGKCDTCGETLPTP